MKLNPAVSLSKVNDSLVALYEQGHFKTLECDFQILHQVIEKARSGYDYDQLVDCFSSVFPEGQVRVFLDVLMAENILQDDAYPLEDQEPFDKEDLVRLLVVGAGKLPDYIFRNPQPGLRVNRIEDIAQLRISEIADETDCVLISGDHFTCADLIDINELLKEKEIPFIPLYSDGLQLYAGPFVFPWKGACLGAKFVQHLTRLNEGAAVKLSLADAGALNLAQPIEPELQNSRIDFIWSRVLDDIRKVNREFANFTFFQRELIVNLFGPYEEKEREYYPTTAYSFSHKNGQDYLRVDSSKDLIAPDLLSASFLDDQISSEVVYMTGGLRSASTEEARELIDQALKKLDLDIGLHRVQNRFADLIPVYRANVSVTHKNKTPYFYHNQRAFGKGITEEQAYFSCTFELFERLSHHYHGDEKLICASPKSVADSCISLRKITRQIPQIVNRYDDFDDEEPVDWVWGESLVDRRPVLVPASRVFLTGASFRGDYVPVGSSGSSAGANLIDAILQGLFEVIEHDAWAIGQSVPYSLPIIDYSTVKKQTTLDLIEKLKARGYQIISRDYTNDIGIPVIRTWIADPNDYLCYATNGCGASVDAELALERSITEAVQGQLPADSSHVVEYGRKNYTGYINSRDSLFNLAYFKRKDIDGEAPLRKMSDLERPLFSSVSGILNYVIEKTRKATGGDVVFVNMTNDNLGGVPAVKVLATGDIQVLSEPLLCPSTRLLDFARKQGYIDRPLRYDELYLGDYPH